MEISAKRLIIETIVIAASAATIGGLTYGALRRSKLNVSTKEEKRDAFISAFISAGIIHLIVRNFVVKK